MSKLGKLYISSFNCKGVKSSLEFVSTELCNKYDIIALQELWILPNETELCNTIHPYFESFSTSSVEVESGILSGRPYGGMGLLWRKTLDPFVKPVSFQKMLHNLNIVLFSMVLFSCVLYSHAFSSVGFD